jgi:hypothetical protein
MKFGINHSSSKSILFALGLILAILTLPARGFAQGTNAMETIEPRNAVSVILMSGLVGGILGLSTLSFYERPQDNIRNITIGAGVGMISAALFMTYTVSQAPPPVGAQNLSSPDLKWAPVLSPEEVGLVASIKF